MYINHFYEIVFPKWILAANSLILKQDLYQHSYLLSSDLLYNQKKTTLLSGIYSTSCGAKDEYIQKISILYWCKIV